MSGFPAGPFTGGGGPNVVASPGRGSDHGVMTPRMLLGRYELNRLIGRGGMAEVWEARDTRLDRRVAVKVVNLAATRDSTVGERLQREGVAIASLRHPDIVTVYDAGVEGDTAYLVMELIEGTDLVEVLRDGPVPVPQSLRIAERVAGALSAAHAAGIVHRDVKPANVLLHADDVTVVDFGIAAAAQFAGASLTDPGTVVGTAEYMAPEQAHGAEVSPASDIYALGCLITAMLTGRPPFTGAPPLEILRQHVTSDPPHLTTLVPDIPPDLDTLVAAMLAKHPADRPSAPAVLQALQALLRQLPAGSATAAPTKSTSVLPADPVTRTLPLPATTPTSAPSPEPALRADHTRRRWLGGGVTAAVLAGIALVVALLGGDPADTQGGKPTTGAATSTPTEEVKSPDPTAASTVHREDGAEGGMDALLATLETDAKTRTELQELWAAVTDAVAKGKADKIADKARDLSQRIDTLVREGKLDQHEANALQDELTATLAGVVPDVERK